MLIGGADMNYIDNICNYIEDNSLRFIDISDQIWEYAELGFDEYKSAELISSVLENEGFEVSRGIAEIETAFVGSYGKGTPVIAILGEYDALPGLSQKRAIAEKLEEESKGNGHGCGHSLLGAGSLAAVLAVKNYIQSSGMAGTIRYYGCPGEEYGSGKTFMTRAGCFDDVDIALCWHPSDTTGIFGMRTLANLSVRFKFEGVTAHAAVTPHLGRSALDAVELMNVGANYLREHIIPEARIHYAITNSGGNAPNVVPDHAEVLYYIRAPKVHQAKEVYNRLINIAKGASLMTDTKYEVISSQGLSDYIPNKTIGEVLHSSLMKVGSPSFNENNYNLATDFMKTLSTQEIMNSIKQVHFFQGEEVAKKMGKRILYDFVGPYIHSNKHLPGSTDVGDVSYVVPTAQLGVTCCAFGTSPHTWQFTAQAASDIGYKGMLTAGKAMGVAAVEILHNPSLVGIAKQELVEETRGEYLCPIPKEITPDCVKKYL